MRSSSGLTLFKFQQRQTSPVHGHTTSAYDCQPKVPAVVSADSLDDIAATRIQILPEVSSASANVEILQYEKMCKFDF